MDMSPVSTEDYYNNVSYGDCCDTGTNLDDFDSTTAPVNLEQWPGFAKKQRTGRLKTAGKSFSPDQIHAIINNLLRSQRKLFLDETCGKSDCYGEIIRTIEELRALQSALVGDGDLSKTRILQGILSMKKEENLVKEMAYNNNPSNNIDNSSDTDSDSEWRVTHMNKKRRTSDHIDMANKQTDNTVFKFKNMSELTESKRSVYKCKECKHVFNDFRALGGHMASHNRMLRNMSDDLKSHYDCPMCKEVFDDFRALGGHIASHNRKKRAAEQATGMVGTGDSTTDHEKKQKSYVCDICWRQFSSGQALGGHKTYHRKLTDKNNSVLADNKNSEVQSGSDEVTSCSQNPRFEIDLNAIPDEDF